jgi:hypothetical protein
MGVGLENIINIKDICSIIMTETCLFVIQVIGITIAKDGDLPPLRNPDILVGENDLTTLSYLHEPAGTVWVVVKSITYVY